MKTKPRPKTKIPKHMKDVPDMYPDFLFPDTSLKPFKINEKVAYLFQKSLKLVLNFCEHKIRLGI